MNVTVVVSWLIAVSLGLLMLASLRNSGLKSLWFWESAGVLSVLGIGFTWNIPGTFEFVSLGWLLLFLLPALGFSYVQQQVSHGHYRRAKQLAQILSVIHPGDGWPDYPDVLEALALVQRGKPDIAVSILKRFHQTYTPTAIHATLTRFRLEQRWSECLHYIEQLPGAVNWKNSPTLCTAYARGLAETQRFAEFFEWIETILPQVLKQPKDYNQLIIIMLAFGGQWPTLQQFFSAPASPFVAQTQAFWLATAAMTSGQIDFAQSQFQQLSETTSDSALQNNIRQRLQSPLPPTRPFISERLAQGFQELNRMESPEISRYDFGKRSQGNCWVTWSILIANLLIFGLEIQQGGSENLQVLDQLGALDPFKVMQGDYWRLIMVNFLHAGPLHLSMNMLGLLVLGPYVEKTFGALKFFCIYSVSAIGTGLCLTYLPQILRLEPEFTVGASGAIMGLVGSIAAIMLWGWLVERVRLAAKRFRAVLIMIGIQLAFDFSTPQISKIGHLSGLVIGFLITGLVILVFGFKRRDRSTQSLI